MKLPSTSFTADNMYKAKAFVHYASTHFNPKNEKMPTMFVI